MVDRGVGAGRRRPSRGEDLADGVAASQRIPRCALSARANRVGTGSAARGQSASPGDDHPNSPSPAPQCTRSRVRKRRRWVDLWGRLSNPPEAIETVAAQGSQPTGGTRERSGITRNEGSDDPSVSPREEKGRLSNPTQRRLSPTDTDDLIAAYRSGTTINELAPRDRIHRSTVTATLNRHHVERHHSQTEWTSEILADAADLYASGLALAAVAARYGVDPQTVANRFRRAGIPVRPRRGWPPQDNRN